MDMEFDPGPANITHRTVNTKAASEEMGYIKREIRAVK